MRGKKDDMKLPPKVKTQMFFSNVPSAVPPELAPVEHLDSHTRTHTQNENRNPTFLFFCSPFCEQYLRPFVYVDML